MSLIAIITWALVGIGRWRADADLSALDDHLLADIGLRRSDLRWAPRVTPVVDATAVSPDRPQSRAVVTREYFPPALITARLANRLAQLKQSHAKN